MGKKTYTMPWKGLKFGAGDDIETRKGPALDTVQQPRRSEHVPRQLTSFLPRLSESTANIPKEGNSNGAPDHHCQEQNKKRSRFNLMRLRHASDPQLSTSYKNAEQSSVPPVPPPPKIITTAPTSSNVTAETSTNKRKSIFGFSSNLVRQNDLKEQPTNPQPPARNGTAPAEYHSQPSTSTLGVRSPHISFEEPERPSSMSTRDSSRAQSDGHWGLFPGARNSESSRSDGSSAGPVVSQLPVQTNPLLKSSALFKFPRTKKSRNSLFPLPVKVPPPDQFNSRNANTSNPIQRPASQRQDSFADVSQGHFSSPSQSSFGRGTPHSGSPRPPLLRHNSTTSARSARSSASLKKGHALNRRGRSSTLGSLAGIQDDPHQSSSDVVPSSRTSTNTAPRKSFSDLFNISQRLRNNTDHLRGDGSPGSVGPTTPKSAPSKSNSFSIQRELAATPPREENDTPATYLEKLEGAVNRKAIATILCQSGEEFYATALRKYIRGFAFFGDPIDMSLRKLLMEAELPKETQQIDRLVQAFANRYHECNPGVFASTDQAYFIAFSLLILHTDVFNKNNKRKMQKQDYVKNTRGEGIANEILECFYDNICYTPFIHVEDEVNLGTRLMPPKSRNILLKVASSDHLPRSSRDPVDPYALILDNKLGSLRPNLKNVMELEDVYNTGPSPNVDELHRLFSKPCILQIVSARSRPDAFLTQTSIANPAESHPGLVDVRVAKVGLLWRKDPKKKKTRSPWQEWGAILTGSQLYFFRDVQWVKSLMSQQESKQKDGRRQPVTFTPPVVDFKPDTTMPIVDSVALLDMNYKKHKHAFVFVRHGGFEEVFLANSEGDMNEWLHTLNYAAAFRTTGVRMRGMIGVNYQGQRRQTRSGSVASEASELPDPTDTTLAPDRRMGPDQVEEVFVARRELVSRRVLEAEEKLTASQKQLDDQLRNARHLQVLTPVHPRARDQVILAAGKMSAKIKWARTEIWRTKCHRDVLAQDLAREEERLGLKSKFGEKAQAIPNELPLMTNPFQNSEAITVPASPTTPRTNRFSRPASPSLSAKSKSPGPLSESSNRGGRRASVRISLTPSEPTIPTRKDSIATSKSDAALSPTDKRSISIPRQASIASRQSRPDASSLMTVPTSSHRATPSPSVLEEDEERYLRETGILPGASSAEGALDSNRLSDGQLEQPLGESRSKVRRSLHRTLRDAHIPHHHRSKKGKDQASASGGDDQQEKNGGTGLTRSSHSFTVHGKKASVVTFGSEWQNMSPEQRLKQRKAMVSEDSRALDMLPTDDGTDSLLSEPVQDRMAYSVGSGSVGTGISLRSQDILQAQPVPEVPEESKESDTEANKENAAKHPDPAVSQGANTSTATTEQEKRDTVPGCEVAVTSENGVQDHAQADKVGPVADNKSLNPSLSEEQLNAASAEQAVKA